MARKSKGKKKEAEESGQSPKTLKILGAIATAFFSGVGGHVVDRAVEHYFPPPPTSISAPQDPTKTKRQPQYLYLQDPPSAPAPRDDLDIQIKGADNTSRLLKASVPSWYMGSFLYRGEQPQIQEDDRVMISYVPAPNVRPLTFAASKWELQQSWEEWAKTKVDWKDIKVTNIEIKPSQNPETKDQSPKKA